MGKIFKHRNLLTLTIIICLLLNVLGLAALPEMAAASGYSSSELARKAVDFIQQKYASGETIDGYTAYVLSLAGEDLAAGPWVREGKSVRGQIEELADLSGNNNSLISYILATQNSDGSFGPLANEYGTKVALQALAAVKDDIPAGEAIYSQVQDSIKQAVDYFKNKYQAGLSYDVNGDFDYRCVVALAAAGEELNDWRYEGKSLRDIVLASAAAAAEQASTLDAVYLAKELAALQALAPDSGPVDTLANSIISKQKTEGEQVYFGNSIYDTVMVLTALGKAGKLSGVDQAKVLNYLNTHRHEHHNVFGQPAGYAWGGWEPEESDTTAQVLAALSYFDDAKKEESEVYRAIQGGLLYLQDIQDLDTGAITHTYDSAFATAETLIALKALGMTYEEYAGSGSPWVKKTKTKTIAQCLLALNEWGESGRVNKLVGLLTARHSANGFEGSVYSDMWAYIALGEAGQSDKLDQEDHRTYILSKQSKSGEAVGSWGDTYNDIYYPDFMSTAQAIRALTYLTGYSEDQQVQDAINKGLAYLRSHQQADGSVYVTSPLPEDPVVDTAEVIITLKQLGLDPAGWKNAQGLTPVSYLMNKALNDDGSFGSVGNIIGAAEALHAYLLLDEDNGGSSGNPGAQVPDRDQCWVEIAVVGMDGELLYGPATVSVSKDGTWGLTVLGALEATGLSYSEAGGLVTSIAGQVNSGLNGWMYKVNGVIPGVGAGQKSINNGDQIIWWYSTDINSSGPSWSQLLQGNIKPPPQELLPADLKEQNEQLPPDLQATAEALNALENIEELLGIAENRDTPFNWDGESTCVVVVNTGKALSRSQWRALRAELAGAGIKVSQEVTAASGAVVSDSEQRIALNIPAGALAADTQITIKSKDMLATAETAGKNPAAMPSLSPQRQVVVGYEFGPEGTAFSSPVLLSLKIALPPLVRPQDLTLAWYDKAKEQWVPVPAVLDVSRGLLLARINHFSDYVVFAREIKKSFSDVTDSSFGWARNVIETLAGAGIIAGVDGQRFEPARPVSRAEFACLLVRALELEEVTAENLPFTDVKAGAWYAGAVTAAAEAGLIKGYEDGTFAPDNTITREEIVAILARALELPPSEQELIFKDSDEISAWARDSMAAAAARGLIKGFADGTIRPRAATSRAECAGLLYRMIFEYLA
ncbi:MAG: DUF4430 domain-containing protein [Clostridia bacterium]|nr:DUF4430 domain-containing protein [Clostridia bacterium]